jgi:hypothetical protein
VVLERYLKKDDISTPRRRPPTVRQRKRETRNEQVKSAVLPSEKTVFEDVARQKDSTLSDVIRDYLIREAKKLGLLPADYDASK